MRSLQPNPFYDLAARMGHGVVFLGWFLSPSLFFVIISHLKVSQIFCSRRLSKRSLFSSGLFKGLLLFFVRVQGEETAFGGGSCGGENTKGGALQSQWGSAMQAISTTFSPAITKVHHRGLCVQGEHPTNPHWDHGCRSAVLAEAICSNLQPHIGLSNGREQMRLEPQPQKEKGRERGAWLSHCQWMGLIHAVLSPEPIAVPKPGPTVGPEGMQPQRKGNTAGMQGSLVLCWE